jgi:phosphatidylserine/phosphatidylglycerophosphate/cardiolipin synthase-like enzyme
MLNPIFLRKDGQKSNDVASHLADFISGAEKTLYTAIYDCRLEGEDADIVLNAYRKAVKRGVDVKILYDQGKTSSFDGTDPAPQGTADFLTTLAKDGVLLRPIHDRHIMHQKYVIRDGDSEHGTIWTGSANFTEDAWTLQENMILQIESPELCMFYNRDFGELWHSGKVYSTGVGDNGTAAIEEADIEVLFAPGDGRKADAEIANLISNASSRVKIASMVLSSGVILGALTDVVDQLDEFSGIYDGSNMDGVMKQWKQAKVTSKMSMFEEISKYLVSKPSTPYTPTSPHDYMHNKLCVVDDTVVVGSMNFSETATKNAENVLLIHDQDLADQCSDYIDEISSMYAK